jgi:hypothetical protein
MQFTISLTITMPQPATSTNSSTITAAGSPAQGSTQEVLTLSPSVPLAVSSSHLVSAKLLGDLATYTQLPAIR